MRIPGLVCLIVVAAMNAEAAVKWKPVDRADLAATKPVVQPDADAEAIFWEVRVADELSMIDGMPRTVFDHYLRIKIFSDRGREAQASIDIPHFGDIDISNVVGRTIK